MSASKPPKPPGKGPLTKPFLGEDLAAELDAWDQMFDGLHGGPESAASTGEMAWPEQDPVTIADPASISVEPTTITAIEPGHARGGTLDENDSPLAAPMQHRDDATTADRGHVGNPPPPDIDIADPMETDFSGVGAEGNPAALGDLLGRSPSAPPMMDEDEPDTRIHKSGRVPRFDSEDADGIEDDGVFTSASRPVAPPSPSFVDDLALDDVAPPPPPTPPRTRTGPAIVRRTPAPGVPRTTTGPIPRVDETRVTPPGGHDVSMFAEQTRVADFSYEDRAAVEAPPLGAEDAYDDIEIGEHGGGQEAAPQPSTDEGSAKVGRRVAAHVLRREPPTKPPPKPVEVRHVVEVEVEDDAIAEAIPLPRAESAEDDFSDVAAAVGAGDEIAIDEGLPDRPSSPIAVPHRTTGPRALSEALGDLDDGDLEGEQDAKTIARPMPSREDLYPRVKTPTSVPPLGAHHTLTSMSPPIPERRTVRDSVRIRTSPLATPMHPGEESVDVEPTLDLEAIQLPEQVAPLPTNQLDEAFAAALIVYEREIATVDDSAVSAALRVEAGRLCERLTDFERARAHYDAALLADPRATPALRGLRRLARTAGDLQEATRHLEAEIAVAGALERRPLANYRVDLLMASGEQDLARVAVGEILDNAPSDVRALLAQLELAFLDGRADEFGIALEQLAHAVGDPELRAAVQSARAVLAAHGNDESGAASWFAAAAESDPASLSARLGAVRHAAAHGDGEAAGAALLDIARQVEATDPTSAAALAVRAQQWATAVTGERAPRIASDAAALATAIAPSDPLVARLAAESGIKSDPAIAGAAFAHWAATASSADERGYAAARAAELDPSRGAELWAVALDLDPGDDYAAAQLRTAHVAADATQAAIDVDLAVSADVERERARLRAAYGLIGQGELDAAIDILTKGRAARPSSLAFTEALGEALAAAGRWSDRARLFAELANDPGDQLDREVAQLRSALAWEEAVGAAAETNDAQGDLQRATTAALAAWETVLEHDPSPAAHAAAIVLATRLGDRDVIAEALMRAQTAERSPWAASSLALRRARLSAVDDPLRAESVLRDVQIVPPIDDPRRTAALVLNAARRKELADAAAILEERATQLDDKGSETEVAALRLRAAQLALDAGDAVRATMLLNQVETALPTLGVVPDLLAAARRRAGDRPTSSRRAPAIGGMVGASAADAFARVMRDADAAAAANDGAVALSLYQRALELRPGDPLASVPLARIATQLRDPAPISALAFAELKAAEASGDNQAKASAYELLAHIDAELRSDPSSAQLALESASQADPSRLDLLHRLERNYTATEQVGELIRLRSSVIEAIEPKAAEEGAPPPPTFDRDRTALLVDLAGLAARDQRPDDEIAAHYRSALAIDPKQRLALFHLESFVRRPGFSPELAELEEKIATYFEGDPRSQAAFYTRAGETLAELGRIDSAVAQFGRAESAVPGYGPALEGWRQAALKGQLWLDVAEGATRQARGTEDPKAAAALHHLAGVALMDKALAGDQAMLAFRRALECDPAHKDAFLRVRILLEEEAKHEDLATVLAQRLEVEPDRTAKNELHRALAELHRNFLSDRDTAKMHYRAILEGDPNDLRAHAAVADIAWEQGNWQEAADALMSRAKLESSPEVLKTLCYRLGLIYADRLVDVPMALRAFQRALTYQPDDENTLIRLADLATTAGEWKLALGACERLVKGESDPDRRASHLHRVARIFKNGFGDMKRAERALNLALDGAPTNDDALAELIRFYREANDITSVRVHLNRVAGGMRHRLATDPRDGVAARVISRAMAARAATGVDGSFPIARAAAELAEVLGASGDPERLLLNERPRVDVALLLRPEADDVMYPRSVQPELRQLFRLLGDRIAKHVGVDLRPYGVARGDRQRARDSTIASVAQSVASALGFGEIDVYVSSRQPWVMVAEPTSPVSLVLGQAIGESGGDTIRFAAGAALRLAQASLAIPARLSIDELGVLVIALLRLFQPEFPAADLDANAIAAQMQKLKRLIPTGMLNELRPYALAIDAPRFRHEDLARDLRIAGLRAGLVASGSLVAGLRILAAQNRADIVSFLADPMAQGLVAFALGEDHAVVAR